MLNSLWSFKRRMALQQTDQTLTIEVLRDLSPAIHKLNALHQGLDKPVMLISSSTIKQLGSRGDKVLYQLSKSLPLSDQMMFELDNKSPAIAALNVEYKPDYSVISSAGYVGLRNFGCTCYMNGYVAFPSQRL